MAKMMKIPMVQSMIIELRGERVILDSDLSMLYQVTTRRLMEQVKRNIKRFPSDFMFQLSKEEWAFLKSQIATSGRISEQKKKLPYVFTRNGSNMVSALLRSPVAISRSIQIMRAFSALEELVSRKPKTIMQSPDVLKKLSTHSRAIMQLFQESKVNKNEIKIVKKLQTKMIDLLQQIIISSLSKEE